MVKGLLHVTTESNALHPRSNVQQFKVHMLPRRRPELLRWHADAELAVSEDVMTAQVTWKAEKVTCGSR